jgi:hypothetical protein
MWLASRPWREKNFLDPVKLAELEPSGYDQIILLARASMGDVAHADAATITTYLSLQHIFSGHEKQPKLFVEILEEENRLLFDNRRTRHAARHQLHALADCTAPRTGSYLQ